MRRQVIVDCDCGTDDAQALLLLLADDSVDVVAVTTVYGNTTIEKVVTNVLRTLAVAGRLDIPVFCGCERDLLGRIDVDEKNAAEGFAYHGDDGLGDAPSKFWLENESDVAQRSASVMQGKRAAVAMIELAERYKGLTLLCLGPLTNVALALRVDRRFADKVGGCVIMGGNYSGGGNVTPTAEHNFMCDPESADQVLKELHCKITVVGFEVCNEATVDWDWLTDQVWHGRTARSRFLSAIHQNMRRIYRMIERYEFGYSMFDEWAAVVLIDEAIVKNSLEHPTAVETGGLHSRGMCVIDKRSFAQPLSASVRHVVAVDVDVLKRHLVALSNTE